MREGKKENEVPLCCVSALISIQQPKRRRGRNLYRSVHADVIIKLNLQPLNAIDMLKCFVCLGVKELLEMSKTIDIL